MESENSSVYTHDNLEFITVAADYCRQLEHATDLNEEQFVDRMLKVMPLLYLKMAIIDTGEESTEMFMLEEKVTEDDYNYIRTSVYSLLGANDDYLDVFESDMKYSDQPIRRSISEDLADIYQDLRNFIWIVGQRNEEETRKAIIQVTELFETHWGQILLNSMRALHEFKYSHLLSENL